MKTLTQEHNLEEIYKRLDSHFGDLGWWPADSAFEVIIGAILTQNTAWQNVEQAIENIKSAGLLDPLSLAAVDQQILEQLIRPSGYFRIKTSRIKNFLNFLQNRYDCSLKKMFCDDLWELRKRLLEVKGIGKETADSILLYAGHKPIFVIDAYTKRILSRHEIIDQSVSYDEIQRFFMNNLPAEVNLFKQYHALIVNTGKKYCRKSPLCRECPLSSPGLEKKCFT
ncbi:MAG: Endonuclease III [Syntrophus sp. PtaB.Bin001]|nr:MAG: Endonuclease III [Syntrophus sp. PtaB.Bin001]